MFFWFQKTGGEELWHEALSSHRQKIVTETKPAFVTVLDAHSSPEDSWGREEFAKMKYSGPLYFDWDSEDVNETIPDFKKFLEELRDHYSVDLRSLRLYATGGRGFHVEIPEAVFMPKVPKTGTANLAYIYKEMAMELVTDFMDMTVYTGRKGRMWRVPGVVRSNGKYKVPLTLDQALGVTPESYIELCSEPRPEYERATPELSTGLSAMFMKAQAKMDSAVKNRAKANKDDELLKRFKGEAPPTITRIMAGEGLLPGVGFHKIAMQLAITAHALGKSREDLVTQCEGLVKTHQSDGSRYNSPRKRKEELRRMWDYTHDNACYGYSRGGIRSLCDPSLPTGDLDGVDAHVGVGHVPDNETDDDIGLTEEIASEINTAHSTLLEGLMITNDGIFKRTAEGARMVSNVSFRRPAQMLDAEDRMLLGLEVDVFSDGKRKGRQLLGLEHFKSRGHLSGYCAGYGGIFSGSDTQAGVIQLLLARSAAKRGKVIYIVRKEGLDIVQDPTVEDAVKRDVIWACGDAVMTDLGKTQVDYRFRSKVAKDEVFNTDIHKAKLIEDTPATREWLHHLFHINAPHIVAQLAGWFTSCFHKQFYQIAFKQFPLLHPNGQAGSGKTLSTEMFSRLFHNTSPPKMLSCAWQATSNFALKGAWTGSASIPVILDEYKPSELGLQRLAFLQQHFRLIYNQGTGASGGISRGGSESSYRDISQYTYSAPTVYIGESQEMQTAIMQRSLAVGFLKSETEKHTDHWYSALAGVDHMPSVGHLLLLFSLRETVESRRDALEPVIKELRAGFDRNVHDRQVYNLAVVLAGLRFLGVALGSVFKTEFDEDIKMLCDSIYEQKAELNVAVMSETAKVFNDMALMSRTEEVDSEFSMREGYEYIVVNGTLDVLLREAYVKYFAWSKRKGFSPIYVTAESFIAAAAKFPPVIDRLCFGSPLKSNGQSRVFRLDLEKLSAEGIEPFKTRS